MIPTDDRGLTLGDGLFETILARDGRLVLLKEHLARLARGCATLGLPAPDLEDAGRLCRDAIIPGRCAIRRSKRRRAGPRRDPITYSAASASRVAAWSYLTAAPGSASTA